MSANKPTKKNRLKDHYGLALEEIKLERSISSMSSMVAVGDHQRQNDYLEREIAAQQKQLNQLKKLRNA